MAQVTIPLVIWHYQAPLSFTSVPKLAMGASPSGLPCRRATLVATVPTALGKATVLLKKFPP